VTLIGWILCVFGRHQWWERSTWPRGVTWSPSKAASMSELVRMRDRMRARGDLGGCTAVCGRCPAKRYAW
jgi:hypothetical protein